MSGEGRSPVLVLGVGNILWADEGFGVRCVEALDAGWTMADGVAILDGGTQGLYLVQHLRDADRLILFDAVDFGGEPGALRLVRDAEVPRFIGARAVSLHQTGMSDVLALAELLGGAPREILLIGLQPVELEDYGGGLTAGAAAQVQPALAAALDQLAAWGCPATPRLASTAASVNAEALQRGAYEGGRPASDLACRSGDDRFFPRAG